ncbi:MAG: MFS transporter, partial [Burkholderiales bacterium]|nr:MFS transporter [Burkholderiales bacterium]
LPLVVLTAHYALFQAANNTGVMAGVPQDRRGVVSGLVNLARNLGLISGAAVLGALFAHAAGGTAAAPEGIAQGMRITFGVAAGLAGLALAVAGPDRHTAAARA